MSHFNDMAEQWDDPNKIQMMKTMAARTIEVLQSHGRLDRKLSIVDIGCGTGLFGLEFTEFAQSLIGVDSSAQMLEVFHRKINGTPWIRSILVDLDHNAPDVTADLFLSSMAFHHLSRPGEMIKKLKSLLRPGGALAIVDLDIEDGTFHPDNKNMGVRHFGFSKQTVEDWAQIHEMTLEYRVVYEVQKNDRTYPIFLAIFS